MLPSRDSIQADVQRALAEDIGGGDVSAALIPAHLMAKADVISREPMVVCGIPWFNEAFQQVNSKVAIVWLVNEGEWLREPTILCHINGSARAVLTAERTALNFLQTLAATATQTRDYCGQLEGTSTRLLDTRKTIPGLRLAQKYAVTCGGGLNHRMGLFDAFLIKENHIKACGSIRLAIEAARKSRPDLMVEVEVETLDELREALVVQPDRILLDNFSVADLTQAVQLSKDVPCLLEASGGIDLSTVKLVAKTGVDFISVGSLTKSLHAIDCSLLIRNIS